MPRVCLVCQSPETISINNRIWQGEGFPSLSKYFKISEDSLSRHAFKHLEYSRGHVRRQNAKRIIAKRFSRRKRKRALLLKNKFLAELVKEQKRKEKEYRTEQRRQARLRKPPSRPCAFCGVVYTPKINSVKAKFCSPNCEVRNYKQQFPEKKRQWDRTSYYRKHKEKIARRLLERKTRLKTRLWEKILKRIYKVKKTEDPNYARNYQRSRRLTHGKQMNLHQREYRRRTSGPCPVCNKPKLYRRGVLCDACVKAVSIQFLDRQVVSRKFLENLDFTNKQLKEKIQWQKTITKAKKLVGIMEKYTNNPSIQLPSEDCIQETIRPMLSQKDIAS